MRCAPRFRRIYLHADQRAHYGTIAGTMNNLHTRYLIIALLVSALVAFLFQIVISSILIPTLQDGLAGAAFVAGWWGNLVAAFIIAIMAGRKAATPFIDPRMGRVAGSAIGAWVGAGAFLGNAAIALIFALINSAAVRPGLVVVFGLVSFFVAVVTATIAGRETAQPPPEEEA
jgi:hypothetical protein